MAPNTLSRGIVSSGARRAPPTTGARRRDCPARSTRRHATTAPETVRVRRGTRASRARRVRLRPAAAQHRRTPARSPQRAATGFCRAIAEPERRAQREHDAALPAARGRSRENSDAAAKCRPPALSATASGPTRRRCARNVAGNDSTVSDRSAFMRTPANGAKPMLARPRQPTVATRCACARLQHRIRTQRRSPPTAARLHISNSCALAALE